MSVKFVTSDSGVKVMVSMGKKPRCDLCNGQWFVFLGVTDGGYTVASHVVHYRGCPLENPDGATNAT